jgi:hypothetical protein
MNKDYSNRRIKDSQLNKISWTLETEMRWDTEMIENGVCSSDYLLQ